jgi:hypothetical protein
MYRLDRNSVVHVMQRLWVPDPTNIKNIDNRGYFAFSLFFLLTECTNCNSVLDLYALVETLVIRNPTYSHNMQGLERLNLSAKIYNDIGPPLRVWFIWRHGIEIAQIMVWTAPLKYPKSS